MSKKRDSRIELIRIVSMVLIIAFHLTQNSGVDVYKEDLSFNLFFNILFGIWGKVGVILFVTISAWFLVDVEFKTCLNTKIIKQIVLIIKAWFISITIILIAYALKIVDIDNRFFAMELCTPFYYDKYNGNYYFITVYLVLYMLVPFINRLIANISNKDLRLLVIVLTIVTSGYNLIQENIGSHLLDFVFIYIAVAYLKKNKDNLIERHAIKLFLCTYIGIIISITLLNLLETYHDRRLFGDIAWRLYNRPNIILHIMSFIQGVRLFKKKLQILINKSIGKIFLNNFIVLH